MASRTIPTVRLDTEAEIIEGIRQGLADIEADRIVSHEDAMAEIDAAIEAASKLPR
jgi:predicted transcriptional regulator